MRMVNVAEKGFLVFLSTAGIVLLHSSAHADEFPPKISHNVPQGAVEGIDFSLSATVTDVDGIGSVILNFKFPENIDFSQQSMEPAGKDEFIAVIPGFRLTPEGLDYYIEATDNAGLSESIGFDIDPFRLPVSANNIELSAQTPIESVEGAVSESTGRNKTLWYVLGGVAAAGLVAALIGDDDGGDGNPTTIVFQ